MSNVYPFTASQHAAAGGHLGAQGLQAEGNLRHPDVRYSVAGLRLLPIGLPIVVDGG